MTPPDRRRASDADEDERGTVKPDGTIHDRRQPSWVPWAASLFTAIAILTAVATIIAFENARELGKVEKRDRATSRTTAFRLCSRDNVDRAREHLTTRRREGAAAEAELERPDGNPILDCSPNLNGTGAIPWPPGVQRDFVDRYRDHRLTPSERGVCPGTVLGNPDDALKCKDPQAHRG